jgi:hypothetical protein
LYPIRKVIINSILPEGVILSARSDGFTKLMLADPGPQGKCGNTL